MFFLSDTQLFPYSFWLVFILLIVVFLISLLPNIYSGPLQISVVLSDWSDVQHPLWSPSITAVPSHISGLHHLPHMAPSDHRQTSDAVTGRLAWELVVSNLCHPDVNPA